MITHLVPSAECKHCTVPVKDGNTCTFCKSYIPPESPDPSLPAGADPDSDDWATDNGVTQRLVWSLPMQLPDHLASPVNDIRVVVCQRADGTIVNVKGDDEPVIYSGLEDYTPEDARAIAHAMLAAADLADTWAGR